MSGLPQCSRPNNTGIRSFSNNVEAARELIILFVVFSFILPMSQIQVIYCILFSAKLCKYSTLCALFITYVRNSKYFWFCKMLLFTTNSFWIFTFLGDNTCFSALTFLPLGYSDFDDFWENYLGSREHSCRKWIIATFF